VRRSRRLWEEAEPFVVSDRVGAYACERGDFSRRSPEEARRRRHGFDQDKTTHHFLLAADGGAIEVSVNETSDSTNRDAIRSHLQEIAVEFAHGDFAKPFATHGEVPPGVKTMQQRLRVITFRYEDTAGGGRVLIQTLDRKAKNAVQEFLRYQIREHSTADPLS
jgi:hypothetical protein